MVSTWVGAWVPVTRVLTYRRIVLNMSYAKITTSSRQKRDISMDLSRKVNYNSAAACSFARSISCSRWAMQKMDVQSKSSQKPGPDHRYFEKNFQKLKKLVDNSNFNAAWNQFNRFEREGEVDKKMVTTMLKMCTSSDSQKRFLARMSTHPFRQLQMEDNYVALLILAKTMLIECRFIEAQKVIQQASDMVGRTGREAAHVIAVRDSNESSLSRQRLQILNHFIRGGKTKTAWELFDRIERYGKANIYHYTAMLKACSDSHEARGFIGYMKRNGIAPNVHSYTTLLNRLRIEADDEAAHTLLTKQLPAIGITPDAYMLSVRPEDWLMKERDVLLKNLIRDRNDHAAWTLFERLEHRGKIDLRICETMHGACKHSRERFELIQRMRGHRLEPNLRVYNGLVRQLVAEGDMDSVNQLLSEISATCPPDAKTWQLLDLLNDPQMQRRRDSLQLANIEQLAQRGDTRTAKQVLAQLERQPNKDKGVRLAMYNEVLRGHLHSLEMRDWLLHMSKAGCAPDIDSYNALLKQLRLEGDEGAVRELVQTDMPAKGLSPDERTDQITDDPSLTSTSLRSRHLAAILDQVDALEPRAAGGSNAMMRQYLDADPSSSAEPPVSDAERAGELEAMRELAWRFFDGLERNQLADPKLFSAMWARYAMDATQQRDLIGRMRARGMDVEIRFYNRLLQQLVFEGLYQDARQVLTHDMSLHGIEPNAQTQRIMENILQRDQKDVS